MSWVEFYPPDHPDTKVILSQDGSAWDVEWRAWDQSAERFKLVEFAHTEDPEGTVAGWGINADPLSFYWVKTRERVVGYAKSRTRRKVA